jgi:hypothetical protein
MDVVDEKPGLQVMKAGSRSVLALRCLALASCIPDPVIAVFEPGDLRPPAVVSWGATGPAELLVVFDEAVQADPGAFLWPGGLDRAGRNDARAAGDSWISPGWFP